MPSTTTNYSLIVYDDGVGDKAEKFVDFRLDIAGTGAGSNMNIIDGVLKSHEDDIDVLKTNAGGIYLPVTRTVSGRYESAETALITSYTTGLSILIVPDANCDASMVLDIRTSPTTTLGDKAIKRRDAAGAVQNILANSLRLNHVYGLVFNSVSDCWIVLDTTNATDYYILNGTIGDFVNLDSNYALQDSGISLDTDDTLAADSDTRIPSQQAVKGYVDGVIANGSFFAYKGSVDLSTNPNYPAANAGDLYIASVAGKIGGASGISMEVGDMYLCKADSTASGDQATVGTYWNCIQGNIVDPVTGVASATSEALAVFSSTTGKAIKSGAAPGTSGNIVMSNGTAWTSSSALPTASTFRATSAEVTTGSDNTKYVTASALSGANVRSGNEVVYFKVIAHATSLTTGDGALYFTVPSYLDGKKINDADASVYTVSSSGLVIVQLHNVTDAVDIMTTRITIDANEYSSYTAATPPVVNTSNNTLATGDRIRVDIDGVGTGSKGLDIILGVGV